jgi:uncharacterized protein (TIGR02996 family)
VIDAASQLGAAAIAVEERRWADAATHLIAAWQACRIERIARAVAAVDLRLPPPRPLEETRVNRREHEFHELVKTGDPEDLRRALAAPWPTFPKAAAGRVQTLSQWASPRISNALLSLHRSGKYTSVAGTRLSRAIFHLLVDQDDHAIVAELERFEAIPHERDRLGAAVFRRRRPLPPYLSPAGEAALAKIEALLVVEDRPDATPRESLLVAIYEAPHDDGPRTVYADVLTTDGDPRGEFIMLQLARAKTGGEPQRREKALLREAGRAWFDGLESDGASKIELRRGFPAVATLASGELRAPAWATIEVLYLVNRHVFRGAPHLRALRELHELGVAELSTATLPSYELDYLSVRDYANGIDVETKLAPKKLGLSAPSSVPAISATVRRLRTLTIGRRVESVRVPATVRAIASLVALTGETGYPVEFSGSLHLATPNQWIGRVTRTSLRLEWIGDSGYGDVAYATIVPILEALPAPAFEEVEITGEAPDTPKVRDALRRVIERWPRLRSGQILGPEGAIDTALTN